MTESLSAVRVIMMLGVAKECNECDGGDTGGGSGGGSNSNRGSNRGSPRGSQQGEYKEDFIDKNKYGENSNNDGTQSAAPSPMDNECTSQKNLLSHLKQYEKSNSNEKRRSSHIADYDNDENDDEFNNTNVNKLKDENNRRDNWEILKNERKEEVKDVVGDSSPVIINIRETENINFQLKNPEAMEEVVIDSSFLSSKRLNSNNYNDYFHTAVKSCNSHLVGCNTGIDRLKGLIVKDILNLGLVVHEPEIWRR